jgi:hypothetical protein
MKLIGLAGRMGSGKDTVAAMLGCIGYQRFGFADALRNEVEDAKRNGLRLPAGVFSAEAEDAYVYSDISEIFAKPTTPRMRALLQQWGTEFRRSQREDYWVDIMRHKLAGVGTACISDVRMPNEAALVRELGGKVWWIKRYESTESSHVTESVAFKVDHVIHNAGTLLDLSQAVIRTLRIQGEK